MSHLYSTFAKQVSAYCKSSSDNAAHCKRELLMYGLGKLHDMSESHLDSMDPYQRGASDISKCFLLLLNIFIYIARNGKENFHYEHIS